MNILFWMEKVDKVKFQKLPGVKELLEELKDAKIPWEYQQNWMSNTETSLIITDKKDIASNLQDRHICCIGYQNIEDTEFFQGASAVCYSFEDIDVDYLEMVHHHFYGIPVVIAETERLVIRESCMKDFDELYRISREAGNDRYMETMSADYKVEKEKFQAYISTVYNYFGFGLWTILEKDTREIVGRCGISMASDNSGSESRKELGYVVSLKKRRKGYASEACRAILQYMLRSEEEQKIYARIKRENLPSRKVAEKLGFVLDQIIDDVCIYLYDMQMENKKPGSQ